LLHNTLPVFYRGEGGEAAPEEAVSFNEVDHEKDPGGYFLGGAMGMSIESVFQPEPRPRILKTNIGQITKHVIGRITAMGLDVVISYSGRTKSRYLDVRLSNDRTIVVRISDHPASPMKRWRYMFDIHTDKKRGGSVDYIEFLDAIKIIL
jgi:hypothetical protein